MCNFTVMQVQKVRRVIVGFERGKVLGTEMCIRLLSRQDREKKRQVGVVRIQQVQPAQIQSIIAGNRGEVSIELIVSFDE